MKIWLIVEDMVLGGREDADPADDVVCMHDVLEEGCDANVMQISLFAL